MNSESTGVSERARIMNSESTGVSERARTMNSESTEASEQARTEPTEVFDRARLTASQMALLDSLRAVNESVAELQMLQMKIDLALFLPTKAAAWRRMTLVLIMCANIANLKDFNVFRSQCDYLVQVIVKGAIEVAEAYRFLFFERKETLLLYTSHKLVQLVISLDNLLRNLTSALQLLQACRRKKWKRAALVLSMPPPELRKYSGSNFLLLIRDFNWCLETLGHSLLLSDALLLSTTTTKQTLSMEEVIKMRFLSHFSTDRSDDAWKFEWCPRRCRYKIQRNVHASERWVELHDDDGQQAVECKGEIRVGTEARSHAQGDKVGQQASGCQDATGVADYSEESLKADYDRQAQDRKDFLDIKKENLTAPASGNSFFPSLGQLCFKPSLVCETPTDKFLAIVKNRCQDTSSSSSTDLVSKCFEINHSNLEMKKLIFKGPLKCISRANWLGQEVAVAIVQHRTREEVEKEAGFLVKLHHPNVVDFFGFALEEEALTEEDRASVEKIEPKWTGYLVMELMQEDLHSLIRKLLRGLQKQEHKGPFPLSVTVDILLQIVGAMIHTHNFDILHRDLKPPNCLVSPKPMSITTGDGILIQYYTVKLIDFEDSKLWAPDNIQSVKKGTVGFMAPEVWQSSKYSKSADVYSFGMTCYEVVTGLIPFQGIECKVMDKVLAGIPPTIPGTCPQSLSDLMKKCWAHAPEDRPTFEEVQRDLWAIKYSVDVP